MALVQRISTWPPSECVAAGPPPQHLVREDICRADPAEPLRNWVYNESAIGFVTSGWFEYRAESGCVLGAPGAVVFGNPGEHFCVRHLDLIGNKRLVISFEPSLLEEVAAACGLDETRFPAIALPPSKATASMFGRMRQLAQRPPQQEEVVYALAADALNAMRLARMPERVSPRDQQRIQSTMGYIQSHFAEPCTLEALAGLAGLSRYHFIRSFRNATGQSPIQYLISMRVRAAADWLLTTSAPIAQVALDVGFNDISHFYACFRSAFHCTPRQWRSGRWP